MKTASKQSASVISVKEKAPQIVKKKSKNQIEFKNNLEIPAFLLVHKGLEKIALQELEELSGVKGKVFCGDKDFSAIEFSVLRHEDLTYLLNHLQSIRGLFFSLGREESWKSFLTKDFQGSKFLFNQASLKIEIEGISDIEERKEITSSLAGKIFQDYDKLDLKVDFKKPQIVALICLINKHYFLGWDLSGQELHKRPFRVFPHQASFTGDIAYYLVRKVGFQRNLNTKNSEHKNPELNNSNNQKPEKLLIGLAKDSSIALEAGVFLLNRKLHRAPYLLEKYPVFQGIEASNLSVKNVVSDDSTSHPAATTTDTTTDANQFQIYAFDESNPNYVASRKNIKIAGLSSFIDLNKYALDELELKYGEDVFQYAIFHFTSKDEEKINEVYYQLNLILKKSGQALFIGRKNWDLPISDRFELLEKEELTRGESTLNLWLMKKK
ncbi:hypothetical protein HYU21_04020 [Candidatus Woesearchaeota archaeon]|nr:hypothetical protein [Candidatus Woesearchaeota archaeon]